MDRIDLSWLDGSEPLAMECWPLTPFPLIAPERTMRHRKAGRKFKRSPSHRRMMLRNLATALIEHGRIETTLAKAKELQPYVEKIITLAKDGFDLNRFRRVLAVLTSKKVAFEPLPRDRPPLQGAIRRLHPDLQTRQGPPGRRRADGRDLSARSRRTGQGSGPPAGRRPSRGLSWLSCGLSHERSHPGLFEVLATHCGTISGVEEFWPLEAPRGHQGQNFVRIS